jgi:uncharacterized Zn finger protein
MSFINCIICGSSAFVMGKPSHVNRKIRCASCGVVDAACKKEKKPEVIISYSKMKASYLEDDSNIENSSTDCQQ